MRALLILILLAAVAAGLWYFGKEQDVSHVRDAREDLASGAERLKEQIQERLENFSLRPEDIREELSRSGAVIRRKTREAGAAIADATADARITARIKGKLVADRELSGLSISVSTTDGVVTLSGSAASPEHIGKAMMVALETEGVHEVISTMQVRQSRRAGPETDPQAGAPEERPQL